MLKSSFNYFAPGSLQEALALIQKQKQESFLVAGGTDLLLSIKKGKVHPSFIVDLKKLSELKYIREENGYIRVGPGISFAELQESELVSSKVKALKEASLEMGSPQIRNSATIGGNIVTASPAADSIPPLMVLEARVVLQSIEGKRDLNLEDFLRGINQTDLQPGEILTEIYFKVPHPSYASAFIKLGRRKALNIARLSAAVLLRKTPGAPELQEARISLGAVAENPFRVREAEEYLQDNNLSEETLEKTVDILSEVTANALGSRKSAPFKIESIKGVARKALLKAANQLI